MFGVASVSPATILPPDWDVVREAVPPLVDEWLAEQPARIRVGAIMNRYVGYLAAVAFLAGNPPPVGSTFSTAARRRLAS